MDWAVNLSPRLVLWINWRWSSSSPTSSMKSAIYFSVSFFPFLYRFSPYKPIWKSPAFRGSCHLFEYIQNENFLGFLKLISHYERFWQQLGSFITPNNFLTPKFDMIVFKTNHCCILICSVCNHCLLLNFLSATAKAELMSQFSTMSSVRRHSQMSLIYFNSSMKQFTLPLQILN